MTQQSAIQAYDDRDRAQKYHAKQGFDPVRKARMLDVTLRLLTMLTPAKSVLLELGAGSGLFTRQIIETNHFEKIYVTDGAPAMLEIAQQELSHDTTALHFDLFDFSQPWSYRYSDKRFQAVTSSMAIHHVEDKQALFREVYTVLDPGGVFVFADHIAGESKNVDQLIGYERGRIRLTSLGQDPTNIEAMTEFIARDTRQQNREGNRCISLAQNLDELNVANFQDVDCLWRDFWMAVFVATK